MTYCVARLKTSIFWESQGALIPGAHRDETTDATFTQTWFWSWLWLCSGVSEPLHSWENLPMFSPVKQCKNYSSLEVVTQYTMGAELNTLLAKWLHKTWDWYKSYLFWHFIQYLSLPLVHISNIVSPADNLTVGEQKPTAFWLQMRTNFSGSESICYNYDIAGELKVRIRNWNRHRFFFFSSMNWTELQSRQGLMRWLGG